VSVFPEILRRKQNLREFPPQKSGSIVPHELVDLQSKSFACVYPYHAVTIAIFSAICARAPGALVYPQAISRRLRAPIGYLVLAPICLQYLSESFIGFHTSNNCSGGAKPKNLPPLSERTARIKPNLIENENPHHLGTLESGAMACPRPTQDEDASPPRPRHLLRC